MKPLTSVHSSGAALAASGALWFASSIIHPSDFDPSALFGPFWVPNAILILLAYALAALGFFGLAGQHADWSSRLWRAGTALAGIGSMSSAVTSYVFGFVAPTVAAQQPAPVALFDLISPGGPMMWAGALLSTYVLFFLPGLILVGICLVRGAVQTRRAGSLLIFGVVLFSLGRMVAIFFPLTAIGGVVFAIALVWLGFILIVDEQHLQAAHSGG